MRNRFTLATLMLACAAIVVPTAQADQFSFTTGSPDGLVGALSRPSGAQGVETETADDFVLTQPTVLNGATVHGLITGTSISGITRVEMETYHIFNLDSDTVRTPNVPTRTNSPSDHEIVAATRDSNDASLRFVASEISDFTVANTVIDGINKFPLQLTHGEGPRSGKQVEIRITFATPVFLPAGHYFLRPEIDVNGGDFLFLSAPRPITSGTPFPVGITDLQAWIRNANLSPDWLRIGGDILGAGAFNMAFSLGGNTVPAAGVPAHANCEGQTVAAMARQFGGIDTSAAKLGYATTDALHDGIRVFCGN